MVVPNFLFLTEQNYLITTIKEYFHRYLVIYSCGQQLYSIIKLQDWSHIFFLFLLSLTLLVAMIESYRLEAGNKADLRAGSKSKRVERCRLITKGRRERQWEYTCALKIRWVWYLIADIEFPLKKCSTEACLCSEKEFIVGTWIDKVHYAAWLMLLNIWIKKTYSCLHSN